MVGWSVYIFILVGISSSVLRRERGAGKVRKEGEGIHLYALFIGT